MWLNEREGGASRAETPVGEGEGCTGGRGEPAPTVVPPPSACCPRCRRILLEGPCPCDPLEAYLRAEAARAALWRALSAAQREALRRGTPPRGSDGSDS
ncbi:MAG: hypothetical protein JWM10_4066 [Myxococcaceae bacterium]|nr:hypothetical protein [Myxococcaceae bacterium]